MPKPFIAVLAGVNGAGKSSALGALFKEAGLTWFNPDTYARELQKKRGVPREIADGLAWEFGRSRLEAAIKEGTNYAFETTLGGDTITDLLMEAAATHDIVMLFCGLDSPEHHMARVAERVKHGGHSIPEAKIHERWEKSRLNLARLVPHLHALQVYDNSRDVAAGEDIPAPRLLIEITNRILSYPSLTDPNAFADTPDWAKPILGAVLGHLLAFETEGEETAASDNPRTAGDRRGKARVVVRPKPRQPGKPRKRPGPGDAPTPGRPRKRKL